MTVRTPLGLPPGPDARLLFIGRSSIALDAGGPRFF
jgi:hypothetical protein